MKTSAVLLFGLPAALAFPSLKPRQDLFGSWSPAGDGDARSPCPCLNALANHDILPHNGQGITEQNLIDAFAAINVGSDVASGLFKGAGRKGLIGEDQILNLDALNEHNAIEHDGSLSRANFEYGDNHTFNQTIFDEYMSYYDGMNTINIGDAAKARLARVKAERERSPDMTYELFQQFASNGETALIMGALGDTTDPEVQLDHLRIVFEEERFPIEEGWQPAEHKMTIVNLSALLLKELVSSGELIQGILDFIPGRGKGLNTRSGHLALLDAAAE